jgi:hypothetical protein
MQALKTQAEALVLQIDCLLSQEMWPIHYSEGNGSGIHEFDGLEIPEDIWGSGYKGYNVCEPSEFEVQIPAMEGSSELPESYTSSVDLGSPFFPYYNTET